MLSAALFFGGYDLIFTKKKEISPLTHRGDIITPCGVFVEYPCIYILYLGIFPTHRGDTPLWIRVVEFIHRVPLRVVRVD